MELGDIMGHMRGVRGEKEEYNHILLYTCMKFSRN